MTGDFLLYGSYGYTGSLIAEAARAQGMQPLLAGRDETRLEVQARSLNLGYRAFPLEDRESLGAALSQVPVVFHCAGPFVQTAMPMVEACLRLGKQYLDVNGEIDVIEAFAARDAAAKANRMCILPGLGFDVVPGDCLAVHLKRRLPSATHLVVAFYGSGRFSRGTLRTSLGKAASGGRVRVDGVIRHVPAGWKRRWIDFGHGPQRATTIPWGEISTAYHSAGIPNIETYMGTPLPLTWLMVASRYLWWALGSSSVQSFLRWLIDRLPAGPDAARRARGYTLFYGEVSDGKGERRISRERGPDGYNLTVEVALRALKSVLRGDVAPGFHTPAQAFGPDFFLQVPGTGREDCQL